jgi:hypothetical protein
MSKVIANTLRHTGASSDNITLTSDGKLVGLNQASPTVGYGCDASLHIHSALSSGTRGAAVHLTTNASGATASDGARIAQVDSDLMVYNHEDGLLLLGINGNETVRIDDSAITFKAPDGGNRYYFGEMDNSDSAELSLYDSSDSQKCKISADSSQHSFFNSGGNVGIGLSSPSDAKLQIETQTDGGGTVFKAQNNDAGNYGGLMIKGGVVDRECRFQSTSGSSFFTFYTEDGGGSVTEKLRILSDGTMRFAMQDFSSSPSASNYGLSFGNTNSGCVWVATATSESTHIIWANGNGTCGSIKTSGTGTSYNTSSDYRLKENIVGITDGITRVKQLAPKRFNFKTNASKVLDGFLAHEVTPIVPEAISGEKDAVEPEDNADKGIKKGDIIPQGIDQAKLVPLLTAALQEAIAKIEVLETKVAALEAR